MSDASLRVALDLDGSLESLGNSLSDLARSLEATGRCDLVRFRSASRARARDERRIPGLFAWTALWRRARGPAIESFVGEVDVVHVAGLATPPTRRAPLVISVDDLRPLRGETRRYLRISQLRRSLERGAVVVASSRRAAREVEEVLGPVARRVAVVPPAVPILAAVNDGCDLVVNVTGLVEPLVNVLPGLVAAVASRGARTVVVASAHVIQRVKTLGLEVETRTRREAPAALARARVVVHMSDGARFPSFAIAALSVGVPTVARATALNRELLGGAAALVDVDEALVESVLDLWGNESRRRVLVAAGRSRASDFTPDVAAAAYLALYREVVRGW